ncbi:hypothetical protein C0030_003650 [Candidatus Liberibacter solanacearum]|uniref:Uncharacterized protein n=1 Tax=Candidatus Liberibacter solanacearum TaxID=556287 RepID=A0A424FM10_9HYPH|nr:hypothetical protein [Candidatus Liberibacter solanacearum]RPD37182.1 hypothetical protein C0030_003650 [Candidatus Liberibacter solanacearum]
MGIYLKRGNNKKENVINNLAPAGLAWFMRIAGFGCLYVVVYLLYQRQYPPSSIIIFLVIPWFSLSLGSAILIASEEQKALEKLKDDMRSWYG